jgi:hypothetical protein
MGRGRAGQLRSETASERCFVGQCALQHSSFAAIIAELDRIDQEDELFI